MGLSQYDSFIRLAAACGWSNAQLKKELADAGVDVSAQAIGKYIRVNSIIKRTKPEAIAYWFGPLFIQQRESGLFIEQLAEEWGCTIHVVKKVLTLLDLPTDERCSTELLINAYETDLKGFIKQEYSLRQVQAKLEEIRGLRCALDTIKKAIQLIKGE